jgi:hypothetical protein
MNVAVGAAVLAAARGDKRARPHRRLPLAQRTNTERVKYTRIEVGDDCFVEQSGRP